jgi:hypothetical protein
MAVALLVFSAVGFGLLLPFLILSLANAFHRERLKEVLRLAQRLSADGSQLRTAPNETKANEAMTES